MSFQFLSNEAILERASDNSNSVSPALEIKGNISSRKDLYISRAIAGNVSCEATVFIAEGGSVEGVISAQNIIIWGEAKGDIQAKNIAAIGFSATIGGTAKAHKFIFTPNCQLPKNIEII
jgi:cytoskeletal protein CcmA (bactofilin family)